MGRKSTKRQMEAGAANLAKWVAKGHAPGALKHGAFSRHIRKRYSDKRTREGKQLQAIIQNIIDDIGPDLSAGQYILLDRVREKLIVLMQIGKFVDRQPSVVNEKGELLPCLGRNYTTYAESLRRDLEALYSTAKKPKSITYEKAMISLAQGTGKP